MYVVTDITKIEILNLKDMQNQHKKKLLLSFTHEFRTPLQWLSGSLSAISVDPEQMDLLKMAKHATNMLMLYMDDMINFNDFGDITHSTQVKRMNMKNCVKECVKFIGVDLQSKKL